MKNMIIAKPTIIKANAFYGIKDKEKYKIMLLWNNNIVETNQESHVEIHLIEDNGNEKIKFIGNIINDSNYNIIQNIWKNKGQTSTLTIRTYNETGLYQELTIPVLYEPYPNIIPISIRNGYLNSYFDNNQINGINIGWDFPTQQEANSLFCYSILISGYTPEEKHLLYISNPSNGIFIPYQAIPKIRQGINGIKNVIVYAINNNEQSGDPFIYASGNGV